jgi:hypothetical protein
MSRKGEFISFTGGLSACLALCYVITISSGHFPHFCFGTAFGSFFCFVLH